MEFLGHMEVLLFIFWITTVLFSWRLHFFSFVSIVHKCSNFSISPLTLFISVLVIVSILLGMWCYFILIFICISLMVSEVEHLFMGLLAIFISSLQKHLLKSFLLFIHLVESKSLQSQHLRLPCPSLSSGVCSNSCLLSWWCHPSSSSSFAPLLSCPQTFPASGYFPMSRLFASGGQRIEASVSASVIPENIQGRCPLGLTDLIFLMSSCSQESSVAPQFESINYLVLSLLFGPTLTSIHDY